MSTLSHYTLNTGHLRDTPRGEVLESTVRYLDPLISGALERGGVIRVPCGNADQFGVRLEPASSGNGVMLWISHRSHGSERKFLRAAITWADEDMAWALEALTAAAAKASIPVVDPVRLPAPVLLSLLTAGAAQVPGPVLAASADLQRCLAWTILAREGLSA